MKLDELKEKEENLEQERMMYLEVDNNAMAKKKEKELFKVREQIEVINMEKKIEIKKELEIYKKYIKKIGQEEMFMSFYNKELSRKE